MPQDRANRQRQLHAKSAAIARDRIRQAESRLAEGDAAVFEGESGDWIRGLEETLERSSASLVSGAREKFLPPGHKLAGPALRDQLIAYYRGLLKVCVDRIDDLTRDQLGIASEPSVIYAGLPVLHLPSDALLYGAKPGGAAMSAMLAAGGSAMQTALKSGLAASSRQPGEFVITDSFGLSPHGVKWVVHLLAQEAAPDKLGAGLLKGMRDVLARFGGSITIGLLGTEAGVSHADAARTAVKAIDAFGPDNGLEICVALPSKAEREAMRAVRGR